MSYNRIFFCSFAESSIKNMYMYMYFEKQEIGRISK